MTSRTRNDDDNTINNNTILLRRVGDDDDDVLDDSDDELLRLARSEVVSGSDVDDESSVASSLGTNDGAESWQYIADVDVTHTPPRFAAGSPESLAYLAEYGYVVIADVADAAAVKKAKSLFWTWVEETTGARVRRDDVGTWSNAHWPGFHDNGIIADAGIGQSPFAWHCRALPGVLTAFASVWSCDTRELITSFDGCGVFRPWRRVCPAWRTQDSGWYHVDQGTARAGRRCCVQGLVTLYDATPATGGLTVIPGTHRHHGALMTALLAKQPTHHDRDYVRLTDALVRGAGLVSTATDDDPAIDGKESSSSVFSSSSPSLLQKPPRQLQPVLVTARAGDLILWDSRTVHCNTPGLLVVDDDDDQQTQSAAAGAAAAATTSSPELTRIVSYVCQLPARGHLSPMLLRHRRNAVECGLTTSHWPSACRPNHGALDTDTYVCRFTATATTDDADGNDEGAAVVAAAAGGGDDSDDDDAAVSCMTAVQRRLIGDETMIC